jgi:hypothetical protein
MQYDQKHKLAFIAVSMKFRLCDLGLVFFVETAVHLGTGLLIEP